MHPADGSDPHTGRAPEHAATNHRVTLVNASLALHDTILCPEDQSILAAAVDQGIELLLSCGAVDQRG